MTKNLMASWFEDDEDVVKPTQEQGKPAESPTEKPDDVEAPKPEAKEELATPPEPKEEELPFHKHPRWKALYEENRTLKSEMEELKNSVETFKSQFNDKESKSQPIPEWFSRLYGDDQDLYNAYKQEEEARISNMEQALMQKLAPKLQKIELEELAEQESTKIEAKLEQIKAENPGIDVNAVMKVVYDKQLFDNKGELNFNAAVEWVKSQSKPTDKAIQEKKSVADKISTEPASELGGKREFLTSEDVRATGNWRNFFNKL